MASLQHPCKTRSDTGASVGAEWLRLVYHDVATHDAVAGTGGLDASIAFELDREEVSAMLTYVFFATLNLCIRIKAEG